MGKVINSDKIFPVERVNELLNERNNNMRVIFTFNEGDIFTAFIPYHHSEELYKLRPCVVVRKPNKNEISIIVITSTSKPESDKEYFTIKDMEKTNLHKEDSRLLLEKYPIPRNRFWKKIGCLSEYDKNRLLEDIKDL